MKRFRIEILLLLVPFGTERVAAQTTCPPVTQSVPNQYFGFYTDRAAYTAGETIDIHGNWATAGEVIYHLWRVQAPSTLAGFPSQPEWQLVRSSAPFAGPQEPADFGSFVDFGVTTGPNRASLSGRSSFTLAGWVLPTTVLDEDVCVIGQLNDDAVPAGGIAGIGIDSTGHLFGFAKTGMGEVCVTATSAITPGVPLTNDDWRFVSLTFDGATLELRDYHGVPKGGTPAAWSCPLSGALVTGSLPLRIGAKDGDLADLPGLLNGRVDEWTLWAEALTAGQLEEVRNGEAPTVLVTPMVGGIGDPLPVLEPKLDARFQDAYGATVADSSPFGHHGTIVGHGTPGMAGRVLPGKTTPKGRSLRLNHDQLVDAGWAKDTEIALLETDPSGLYVVQAAPNTGGTPTLNSSAPWRCQCVVVRPRTDQGDPSADVAVIVPVSTWMAYSGWPGTAFGSYSVTALERAGIRAGNNSVYQRMGDGYSSAHYVGWRRPKLPASPFSGVPEFNHFSVLAPAAVKFTEWIDAEAATLKCGAPMTYHFYSDWDLGDLAYLNEANYSTILTIAHNEYWTEQAVDGLFDFLEDGGNVLSIAANQLLWRIDVERSAGVMEVRRWPAIRHLGKRDVRSLVGGNAVQGVWRLLYQTAFYDDGTPDPQKDYMLGNLPDTAPQMTCIPTDFGHWTATNRSHWLFEGAVFEPGDPRIGLTEIGAGTAYEIYALGHEGDSVIEDRDPPGAVMGTLETIADGVFDGGEVVIDWSDPLMAPGVTNVYAAGFDALDQVPIGFWQPFGGWRPQITLGVPPRGQISTYRHTGPGGVGLGGRVVCIPSTGAVWSLGVVNPVTAQVDPLTTVARNALACMLCDDCALDPAPLHRSR